MARASIRPCLPLLALLVLSPPVRAEVARVVILKVDGVPANLLERYLSPGNPSRAPGREGKSRLPWIEHVFRENGAIVENFYVRGISLSAPSWSLLDTGHHLEIHGNAEYDRFTLRVEDYLNFFPLYFGYALAKQADMPGVELLDEAGIPLLIDRFPEAERYQSFQLLQRSVRWTTLRDALQKRFTARSPRELFDEWQLGFSMEVALSDQTERELLAALRNPRVRYLDYFTGDFDHVAHATSDGPTQLHALQNIDALVGRIWTAVLSSPLADSTLFVMVSDHGMNSEEGVYSQGYSLVDFFNSAAGGAHHVMTNRHPMTEYKLKGLDPFVSQVVTPSAKSTYLAGQSAEYPTATLDLDGNERASVSLRNSDLTLLQILLEQLIHGHLRGPLHRAAMNTFFATLDRHRATWEAIVREMGEELAALGRAIEHAQAAVIAKPVHATKAERERYDDALRRRAARIEEWKAEERAYSDYTGTLSNLLSLRSDQFDPGKLKIEECIPRRAMGDLNTVYELENYIAGPRPSGLKLDGSGSLDLDASFQRINYFDTLVNLAVRNNVQPKVGPHPVDFIATRIPQSALAPVLRPDEQPSEDAVWLYGARDRQALVLSRRDAAGRLSLRYLPVANLVEDRDGNIRFDRIEWQPGLPLHIFEDPELDVPGGNAREWLSQWHGEREWLEAVHRTHYSNGIIGLDEQFRLSLWPPLPAGASEDERLLYRLKERRRRLRRTDLQIFASNHWNFNVRSFNPGGNHGSFFRISTHSVLMFAGGSRTGIPRGARIPTPYDSLSFVPTILKLTHLDPGASFPGPVIKELGDAR